jgi:hypothetical protein
VSLRAVTLRVSYLDDSSVHEQVARTRERETAAPLLLRPLSLGERVAERADRFVGASVESWTQPRR